MITAPQLQHLADAKDISRVPDPYRVFPDGMAVWVYAMTFGNGRLCYGHSEDRYGYESGWCYRSVEAAFEAADNWDGQGEPEGWKKSLQTQEYRKEFE